MIAIMLALALPTGTLVVLDKSNAQALLFDLPSRALKKTLATGFGPHEAAVSPDGKRVVVANYGTDERPGNTLTVIDLASGSTHTVPLKGFSRPHGIQWLSGDEVLATVEESHAVVRVDVARDAVLGSIATNQDVSHMVLVDAGRAFVANIGSGTVSVLNLAASTVEATWPAGKGSEGIWLGRGELWVTNTEAATVTVLDAGTGKLLATLPAPEYAIRARFTPDGARALVTGYTSHALWVYDRTSRKLLEKLPLPGAGPIGIQILDGAAYIACAKSGEVKVIDLASYKVTASFAAGAEPDGMAYSPLSLR